MQNPENSEHCALQASVSRRTLHGCHSSQRSCGAFQSRRGHTPGLQTDCVKGQRANIQGRAVHVVCVAASLGHRHAKTVMENTEQLLMAVFQESAMFAH